MNRSAIDGERLDRVAVVRALRGLGDMLCAVPALRALRRALPRAEVALVGLPAARPLVERFPAYIDELVEFPGYPGIPEVPFDPGRLAGFLSDVQGRYDLAVQMHGSGLSSNPFTLLLGARVVTGTFLPSLWCPDSRTFVEYPSHQHEVSRCLAALGPLGSDGEVEMEFPVWDDDRARARRAWAQLESATPFVCLHPGASEPKRRWPAENFAAVGDALAEAGLRVVLTGSQGEIALGRQVGQLMRHAPVDLTGRTDLGALAALLERAALVLCNDTGVSHLAAALGTRSVVLFVESDPGRWAPLNAERHKAVGTPRPQNANACRHTAEVRGHRCLMDGCSSLQLGELPPWQPVGPEVVRQLARELLRVAAPP